jgi:hypothetical protein
VPDAVNSYFAYPATLSCLSFPKGICFVSFLRFNSHRQYRSTSSATKPLVVYDSVVAIDDPIESIEKQLELEDSSSSDIGRALLTHLQLFPLPWPLSAAVLALDNQIESDRYERLKVYIQTVAEVAKAIQKRADQYDRRLDDLEANQRTECTRKLLVEGARRVAGTRSIARVTRIGIILARGVTEKALPDEDEIEEMMRIARELTEQDVDYLNELGRIYGEIIKKNGRVDRYTAFQVWVIGRWGESRNPEIDSVCSKLESFGLVGSVPGNNTFNVMADIQNRYVLLPKGLRFSELIKQVE